MAKQKITTSKTPDIDDIVSKFAPAEIPSMDTEIVIENVREEIPQEDNIAETIAVEEVKVKGKPELQKQETVKQETVLYKTASRGDSAFMMEYLDERQNKYLKRAIVFRNHNFVTSDPVEIAYLNGIIESEKHLPITRKKILTQDEFDEYVTPEKVWVEYKGITLHIRHVREGLKIAEANGWVPVAKNMIISEKPNINVKRSGGGASVLDAAKL